MQNAKDSFYISLRNRLAALNPERTVMLRGAVRPGILVEEAEAPLNQPPGDVFVLRWQGLGADVELASTLVAQECEIVYQTCGHQAFGGLDRGRIFWDEPVFSPAVAQRDRISRSVRVVVYSYQEPGE